jgi:hypothetical protein
MRSTKSPDGPRRAWRLGELARAYGVSVPFLRLEAARGRLRIRRLGRSIIVMTEDWEKYIGEAATEAQP